MGAHYTVLVTLPGMDRQIQREHACLQVHCYCLVRDKYIIRIGYEQRTEVKDRKKPQLAMRQAVEALRKSTQCDENFPNKCPVI